MLFNSYVFVLLFLPLALMAFYGAGYRFGDEAARRVLLIASLLFFVWWNPVYIGLLIGSVAFNFYLSTLMQDQQKKKNIIAAKNLLIIGIFSNLILLGYYKYTNFFITNINAVAGTQWPALEIVLPLAISFFTFTQIAFLVDVYEGLVEERSFTRYLWLVSFFPHLIAGPIVHHHELMPQFNRRDFFHFNDRQFAFGLFVFSVGLFKKTVIADSLADTVAAGFDHAGSVNMVEAWIASIAYTLQAYFDFSGYSDMAVGLGLLFNIRLPINFNSPYKATSIIGFWQRWHITLTDFINAYIYMPFMRLRSHFSFAYSLMVTLVVMAIVGLWHGASWNFVMFGVLHGLALVVNHLWRRYGFALHAALGWLMTMVWWNLTLVVFRSSDMATANKLLTAMVSGTVDYPEKPMRSALNLLDALPDPLFVVALSFLFMVAFFCCFYLKNPHEHEALFRPSWRYFMVTLACLFGSLLLMNHATEFIYFQF